MNEEIQKQLEALQQALAINPDNIMLRSEVARLCELLLRWDEAFDHYHLLCSQDVTKIEFFLGLARCAMALARWDRAARACRAALDKNRNHPQVHLILSKALRELGKIEEAQKHYEMAVECDPDLEDSEYRQQLYPDGKKPKNVIRVLSSPGDSAETKPGETPTIAFKDVGGLNDLKETIRRKIILPFQRPELFEAYGKKSGGGILLYGPPGCGKTHIARATAGECRAQFFSVEISDILDMWFGESERKLSDLFITARSKDASVIFFDELEAIGGNRNKMKFQNASMTLVSQLLAEMDGYQSVNKNILILGATNAPWHVDPALRRPGRFDRVIFVPPPDLQARTEILTIHAKNRPLKDVDFVQIAKKTEGFSGADLKELIECACEESLILSLDSGNIEPVTMNEFKTALQKLKPTTREWLNTAKNYATYANDGGLYDDVVEYLKRHKI